MTTVKTFHSAMAGAPTLNGTAGSLIAVLDACLVNGFELKSAESIVIAGGVATVNISAGHTYEAANILQVTSAALPTLNGEKRALSATSTQFTFDATGIADQTVTGTITVKRAPAGWQKSFSGTNLAAYRSQDVASTRMFLRVDDTGTQNARVVGYESMTDINTGFGPFPNSLQISGGGNWPKANAANATARAWTVVADSKTFWIHMHTSTTYPGIGGAVWGFGDIKSVKSGDSYACILHCSPNDHSTNGAAISSSVEYLSQGGVANSGIYSPRSFTGLGNGPDMRHAAESLATSSGTAGGASLTAYLPTFPNGADNGIYFTRKIVFESSAGLRGLYRGAVFPVQNCHTQFNWRDIIEGQGDYLGRKMLAVKCGGPAANSSNGVMFFDITGPWG